MSYEMWAEKYRPKSLKEIINQKEIVERLSSFAQSKNVLGDATYNAAYIGVSLPAGASKPGGGDNDVMYWVAGKSFAVNNE